jgi:hypothetical protein
MLTKRLALVGLVLCTGCTASVDINPSQEPSSTPSSASLKVYTKPHGLKPRVTGVALIKIHDPRKVTGTVNLNCGTLDNGTMPDTHCTPGSVDPAVTQDNIQTTICKSGYTATVRPPAYQTNKLKSTLYGVYGIPSGTPSELDHLVPLELGGSNDVTNLWPEVGTIPNSKDGVENTLRLAVCTKQITLQAAQSAIATNWQTAEKAVGLIG